ncbi:hypothetical protein [Sphingobacterium hotanense]|uniref:hypothetical protein n=1 Tax=Sphingobacterium hotanense TaxID=649196 RepID=UPI0021A8C112|nr:hypothetical protein [Sphingobacterium hotanense]MCT1526623.1 hypothetical protein [Sphingobacterium hotanense]
MRRLNFKSVIVACSLLAVISACSKKSVEPVEPDPENPETPTPKPPTPKPLTFFYAGYKYNTDYKKADRNAILSIGDSVINLSPSLRSDALAIAAVNNKEAHVTGYQSTATGQRRVAYWKNNKLSLLTQAGNNNTGTAINVIGSKVYVGGTKDYNGAYGLFLWTNGVEKRKACCLAQSEVTSITEVAGEPYLSGRFASNAHMFNDEWALAIAGPNTYADYINAINKDVYVLGHANYNSSSDAAVVWKNRKEVFKLPLGDFASDVLGTMVGTDYYFVANFYNGGKGTSVVYKNKTKLYQLSGAASITATAIRVVSGKVYILGNYLNGAKSSAVLWTNGKPKVLFGEGKKIYLNDFAVK